MGLADDVVEQTRLGRRVEFFRDATLDAVCVQLTAKCDAPPAERCCHTYRISDAELENSRFDCEEILQYALELSARRIDAALKATP